MASGSGQAAAVNTGQAAPFNITGINSAANVVPGTTSVAATNNTTLAVNNVKRVWGATPSQEDAKQPEAPQASSTGAHVN